MTEHFITVHRLRVFPAYFFAFPHIIIIDRSTYGDSTRKRGRMRKTAVIAAAALAAVGWFSYEIWRMEAATAGSPEVDPAQPVSRRYIALTFDDGPHPVYTPMLLDGLKERDVKASFFLVGDNIDGNEEIVRRMAEEGHLIGNHTSSHVQISKIPMEEAVREIQETNEKLESLTGNAPEYVRPPYGEWSDELGERLRMEPVFWNVDPLDWKVLDAEKVYRHIVKHAEDGSVILLHDSYKTTVQAAFKAIDTLEKQGYTFVTADELLVD